MARRNRVMCIDCGRKVTKVQYHHEPPRCEGGMTTVPLCRNCHVARHAANNDWARWGSIGGQITAAKHPELWKQNLKQYRQKGAL